MTLKKIFSTCTNLSVRDSGTVGYVSLYSGNLWYGCYQKAYFKKVWKSFFGQAPKIGGYKGL